MFDSLRGGGQCNALLGVAFFARFERVEIDFRAGVVRLGPERG